MKRSLSQKFPNIIVFAASGSIVRLIGGAQARNVFWQVGSSATLGTNSTFLGTILALTSVTVTTGTAVTGRVLARNGAVTLDTNTVTLPAAAAIVVPTIPRGHPDTGAGGASRSASSIPTALGVMALIGAAAAAVVAIRHRRG